MRTRNYQIKILIGEAVTVHVPNFSTQPQIVGLVSHHLPDTGLLVDSLASLAKGLANHAKKAPLDIHVRRDKFVRVLSRDGKRKVLWRGKVDEKTPAEKILAHMGV